MTDVMEWVDGNGVAGTVGDIFRGDLTVARGQCVTCGREAMLAEAHVFDRAPGVVARCSACGSVLMRVVQAPDRAWLDMRGLAYLELAQPAG